MSDWKSKDKEMIKDEKKFLDQFLTDFMKPKALEKLEKRKTSRKISLDGKADCDLFFKRIIDENLEKNDQNFKHYDE